MQINTSALGYVTIRTADGRYVHCDGTIHEHTFNKDGAYTGMFHNVNCAQKVVDNMEIEIGLVAPGTKVLYEGVAFVKAHMMIHNKYCYLIRDSFVLHQVGSCQKVKCIK